MSFAIWMSGPAGRLLRIAAGIVLVGAGLYVQGLWGVVIAVVGVVPLLAGILNVCVIAPFLRVPFNGRRLTAG
jgi:hypothetical protein